VTGPMLFLWSSRIAVLGSSGLGSSLDINTARGYCGYASPAQTKERGTQGTQGTQGTMDRCCDYMSEVSKVGHTRKGTIDAHFSTPCHVGVDDSSN